MINEDLPKNWITVCTFFKPFFRGGGGYINTQIVSSFHPNSHICFEYLTVHNDL